MTQTMDIGLEKEAKLATMRAPIPPEQILEVNKGGRGKFKYANMKYLKQRARDADPTAEIHFTSTMASTGVGVAGVLHCEIIIFGVSEEATAGFYIPAQTRRWNDEKKAYEARDMTDDEAHTLVTAAEASAARRAFAEHGIGDELWPDKAQQKTQTTEGIPATEQQAAQNGHTPASSNAQGPRKPVSDSQKQFLVDLGVPEAIAAQLDAYREQDSSKNWFSQAGLIIDFLKPGGLGGNKEKPAPASLVREAITRYAPMLIPAKKQQKPVDPFDDADPD